MSFTLLTGGARSGKSALAVRRVQRRISETAAEQAAVTFVATAQPRDEEMAERIGRHQGERPATWSTVEAPLDLVDSCRALPPGRCVIVDCLALWVSNLMEHGDDEATTVDRALALATWAKAYPGTVLVVTNEVGLGIVPMHPLSRDYRDRLGRVNQVLAAHADLAQLVVAGRTLTLDAQED